MSHLRPMAISGAVPTLVSTTVLTVPGVWIFGQGGAEFMATHHRLFNSAPSSPAGVKILWAVLNGVIISVGVVNFLHMSGPR